uniref:Fibrinogen C-terminal domain-containing protein n=1 Tax=Amphimedon queenslandica TaxID=400682 RepID=A0A1X7U0C2_AMPQE
MSNGGWTVFQRRMDGTVNFYHSWADYAKGFGDLNRETSLRVDLKDFEENKRYATYNSFQVGNAVTKYTLHVSGYGGNAGDSLSNHNGMKFSTYNEDNDAYSGNCAATYKGAWWYSHCHSSNLNGLYLVGSHTSYANGVNWYHFKKHYYSLKTTEMKIRRK